MPDNLTKEQRNYCMSQVKGKDTSIERIVRSELHKRGLRFRKHVKELCGKPDIVFFRARVVVFIDGDFWHGYRFPCWEHKVPDFWKEKIGKNRDRDQKNFRKLKKMGWRVVRIWQHQIKRDFEVCILRVINAVKNSHNMNSN